MQKHIHFFIYFKWEGAITKQEMYFLMDFFLKEVLFPKKLQK